MSALITVLCISIVLLTHDLRAKQLCSLLLTLTLSSLCAVLGTLLQARGPNQEVYIALRIFDTAWGLSDD